MKIIDNVSLENGLITSLEVVNPNNVRFHIAVSNVEETNEEIKISFKTKDGSNNYATLAGDDDYPIIIKITGNTEKSRNILGINSASLKVYVENKHGLVGNISIWTNES